MRREAGSRRTKDAIRNVSAAIYCWSGLDRALHRGKALILAYHRVLRVEDLDESFIQPGMYVLEDVFDKQMRFLKETFEIVPFADLLARWRTGTWDVRTRYCAITFDDGWLDNYLYAYPVLRRHGIPATIFLPTAFIGTPARFWWDELGYLLRRCPAGLAQLSGRYPWLAQLSEKPTQQRLDGIVEKFKNVPEQEISEWLGAARRALGLTVPEQRVLVNWQEVEEMSGYGISFGSHSCTHRILTHLSREEVRKELRDSRDCLRERRIRAVPVFCYPNGDFNQEVIQEVRRAGYEAAVTGRFGFESSCPDDLWRLKRIGVHNDVTRTARLFGLRISGLPWS
jgi:peptidoglycan/xylan/chitin deacetylase (PgdA/CDA1 family)